MTVKLIATGETYAYNDSFAARLIEQGAAIPAAESKTGRKRKAKAEVTEDVTEGQDS